MTNVFPFLLIFFACTITSLPIRDWRVDDIAHWAMSCDFPNEEENISNNKVVAQELCAKECTQVEYCTHFAWIEWNNGTCFFKHSQDKVSKGEAVFSA